MLSLVLFPASLAAQDAAAAEADMLRVSTQFVLLDALVTRKSTGQIIGGLGADDFLLREAGVPQQLSYFSQDHLPLSIVLLFDLTDSVRPVLKSLAGGAVQVLGRLKPEDEVAVMAFSSRTMLLQDFTTDRRRAGEAIVKASQMKDEEGTFIHQDMYEAVDQVNKSTLPGSRRVLIWLTDGSANAQNSMAQKTIGQHSAKQLHSQAEAAEKLQRSGAVVSALIERSAEGDVMIAFGYLMGAHMGDVEHYADLTGGPVLTTASRARLSELPAARLSDLIDRLRRRVTIGYKPNVSKMPGTWCALTLQLSPAFFASHPGLKRSDVLVRAKQGYYR